MRSAADAVDHLLLGVSDLDYGMRWVEQKCGIRSVIGGVHPGRGTRNALLSLGGRRYLEIIAPDPAQSQYQSFVDVRALKEPVLIAWASSSSNIETLTKTARDAGFQITGPTEGSRNKTDGTTLQWRSVFVHTSLAGDPVNPFPFFIQWIADSVHPSQDSPEGCTLESLELEHPDANGLRDGLKKLGIEAHVNTAKTARLIAAINSPKGKFILT